MIKILPATDALPVGALVVTVYGEPGVGKTTLGFSASKPLLLDFDHGAYRATNRADTVQVHRWEDAESISAEDVAGYDTVVVDTVGRALDILSAAIIDGNPKLGHGGALTLQGYGVLKGRFISWMTMLRLMGKDVVLLAHMDEQRRGDDTVERLDIQGGSKLEIYKVSDAMGRLYIDGGKRRLDFSPRDNAFGKNPAQMPVMDIPTLGTDGRLLGDIVTNIRGYLNRITEERRTAARELEDWKTLIAGYTQPADFNGAMASIKDAPIAARVAFQAASVEHGLVFDKSLKCYVIKNTDTDGGEAAQEAEDAGAGE